MLRFLKTAIERRDTAEGRQQGGDPGQLVDGGADPRQIRTG
jgi:hypothetical protein